MYTTDISDDILEHNGRTALDGAFTGKHFAWLSAKDMVNSIPI